MDSLEYKESQEYSDTSGKKSGFELSPEGKHYAFVAEEKSGGIPPDERDTTSVLGTINKGLDLGLNIFGKKPKAAPKDESEEEIFGLPKMIVYGGAAAIGLIATVIIIKRMKK